MIFFFTYYSWDKNRSGIQGKRKMGFSPVSNGAWLLIIENTLL
jgi:hypothetical protein